MASCDSPIDAVDAVNMGWRYFRVRTEEQPILAREISCPASDEMGKRTTCADCRLCSGSRENDARKNIVIIVHGAGSKNFVRLEQIARAA
jgi:hypothetical protein